MREEEVLMTIFTCDQCGKKSQPEEKFPYDKDWCYLYNFEFKLAQTGRLKEDDKHFCSKECMEKHIIQTFKRSYTVLFG